MNMSISEWRSLCAEMDAEMTTLQAENERLSKQAGDLNTLCDHLEQRLSQEQATIERLQAQLDSATCPNHVPYYGCPDPCDWCQRTAELLDPQQEG